MEGGHEELEGAPPAPTTGGAGGARLLRRYLCVAILVANAGWQIWRVHFDGLTPWKGGGFGMYSSVHPEDDELWAEWSVPGRPTARVRIRRPQNLEARALLPRVKEFPTAESLRELHAELATNTGSIQIWRPYLDPDTLEYERVRIAEYDPATDRPEDDGSEAGE